MRIGSRADPGGVRIVPSVTSPPAQAPKPPSRTKKVVSAILTLAVLAFVFFGLFPRFADISEVWESLAGMPTASIVGVLAAVLVNIAVYPWPFQAALIGLRYWPAFEVRQTAFAISNTVPAGGALGLGVQYAMLNSYGFAAGANASAIAITGTWNAYLTLVLPLLALFPLALVGDGFSQWLTPALIGLAIAVGSALVFALILRSESFARRLGQWLDGVISRVARLFKREPGAGVTESIVEFRASIVETVSRRWASITGSNLLMQLTSFAVLYAALIGIGGGGADVGMAQAFAAFAIARLATFIPVTPGGLGTTDAAMAALLAGFGMSNADALAAVLVWRIGTLVPQVILGAVTFLIWRARSGRAARAV